MHMSRRDTRSYLPVVDGRALTTAWRLSCTAIVVAAFLLLVEHSGGATAAPAQRRGLEVVEQLGGASGVTRAVAVDDMHAYVGKGPRVAVYDISDPALPQRIGLTPVLPGVVNQLAVTGEVIIVATSDDSIHVVRIAEPKNPLVVASLEIEHGVYGIAVDGDLAHFTNGKSLITYSFVDPADPTLIAELELGRFPQDVAVMDGFACVATWMRCAWSMLPNPARRTRLPALLSRIHSRTSST